VKSLTIEHYFGAYIHKPEAQDSIMRERAQVLLNRVNGLLAEAEFEGVSLDTNPKTGSLVSGWTNGGFRPKDCPEGAPNSSHKYAMGIDIYDPDGDLDEWISDTTLEGYGLYREHPAQTKGWCHLTTRPPKSGRRTFYA
jgi:hypothetical protein